MWENTDQKKLRIWTLFTQCKSRKTRGQTCVQLICCVLNSSYSFVAGIFIEVYLLNHQWAPTTVTLQCFLKFVEFIVEYFVYKRVFCFPPFCFYYLFMKLFLFQSKTKNTVKDISWGMNWIRKIPKTLFVRKLICEHLKS